MSRYRKYFFRDDEPNRDGDTGFIGVNAKASPERLQSGWVREANNMRFRAGIAATRPGCATPSFATVTGTMCGSGIFSDPFGVEWMLLATTTGVWQVRAGHTPRVIATPTPLEPGGYLALVQAFNTVLMFRGPDAMPWAWNGSRTGAFEPIDQSSLGDGTQPIPNGSDRPGLDPVLLNSRLIVPHDRTKIAVSDTLDYTRYDEAFADFDVTTGNDDTLTALYPFTRNSILCFKDQSIAVVSGIAGTLAPSLDIINRELGCIAGKTVAMVGGDVFFLSGTGVYRLQEIIQDRLQTEPVAVSDPIAPLIGRITWEAAARAVAAVHGEYYYLAVPLDGATAPNAILPFNTVTGAWEGIHTFPETHLHALLVSDRFGERALYGVDQTASRLLRLYTGRSDRVGELEVEITSELATRGFLLSDNATKAFRRAQVNVETWAPNFTVSAETDGVNESKTLGTRTRSRTRYCTFGQPPYDRSNVNNDHGRAQRQDYSIALDVPFIPGTGMALDAHQAAQERFPIGRGGRWCSLRVRNTTGSLRLTAAEVHGDEARRSLRTAT